MFHSLRNTGKRRKVIKISKNIYNKCLWNIKGVTLLKMKMEDEIIRHLKIHFESQGRNRIP